MITKNKRTGSVMNWAKTRKGKTLPDQTMSLKEIVRRFSRGISINAERREAVYSDQDDHDLEAFSRKDFGEKQAIALEIAQDLADTEELLVTRQTEANEAKRQEAEAKARENAVTTSSAKA